MSVEQSVAQHYTKGSLAETILNALRAMGKDPDHLAVADLAPVDEFHTGGRPATVAFAAEMGIARGMHLLDVGSGLGGAARYFASEQGCTVEGIDLTDEFVGVANDLARRAGLADRVTCRQGSALDLPFEAARFDATYMLHVGMNIEDKARLFDGVRRVLKPGGVFGIYDVMRIGAGDLSFPLPWATTEATSFVRTPADYRTLLTAAGFEVLKERDRRDAAIAFGQQARARAAAAGGPPPLGLHLVMGADFPAKTGNLAENMRGGLVAPTEIVCRAV